ncbi:tRNA pseudouridine(38-40) synthase TruA [Pseudoneobacillus sp. C159]
MQRIKCTLAYDGTNFSGYQIQPKGRTVQEEVEKALQTLHKGTEVKIVASGRTDAGVHAKGQVIHFDTPLRIPVEKWPTALNSLLPSDIALLEAEKVSSSFHARFDTKGKEYRYFVYPTAEKDPFLRHYSLSVPYTLNLEAIKVAMQELRGTHNFTSFCAARTEVEDKVRTIYDIDLFEENGMLIFQYIGNGFLYNMVRILTGTLLEIGGGKRTANSISSIIDKKDRAAAGKTAPAHGLYLWKVFY